MENNRFGHAFTAKGIMICLLPYFISVYVFCIYMGIKYSMLKTMLIIGTAVFIAVVICAVIRIKRTYFMIAGDELIYRFGLSAEGEKKIPLKLFPEAEKIQCRSGFNRGGVSVLLTPTFAQKTLELPVKEADMFIEAVHSTGKEHP